MRGYYRRYEDATSLKWTIWIVSGSFVEKVAYGMSSNEDDALSQSQKAIDRYCQSKSNKFYSFRTDDILTDDTVYYEDSYNDYSNDEDSYLTVYYYLDLYVTSADGDESISEDQIVVTFDYYE